MSGKNYLEMSDEEFLKLPETATGELPQTQDTNVEEPPVVVAQVEIPVVEAPVVETEPEIKAGEEAKPEGEAEKAVAKLPAKVEGEEELNEDGTKKTPETPVVVVEPDYKALYNQLITPIKANGKTIEVKSVDDAIRLMQMGAGFGRKMQDIQPHLKTLKFMEQNGLLNADQSDLKFLVDLKNKNPDAIKKLIKDAGIDPIDINNEEPVNYKTNIPDVTDQQVAFSSALEDLVHQEGGAESINLFTNTWDAQSHTALMNDPSLLGAIHEQRQAGIYDRIVGEMDHQKALGKIPYTTPFLAAYKQVGDALASTNGFADLTEAYNKKVTPTNQVISPQVIETKVAAIKSSVSNNAQAKAAATTRTTPRKVAPMVNPLAMSDEEFAKAYGGKI